MYVAQLKALPLLRATSCIAIWRCLPRFSVCSRQRASAPAPVSAAQQLSMETNSQSIKKHGRQEPTRNSHPTPVDCRPTAAPQQLSWTNATTPASPASYCCCCCCHHHRRRRPGRLAARAPPPQPPRRRRRQLRGARHAAAAPQPIAAPAAARPGE